LLEKKQKGKWFPSHSPSFIPSSFPSNAPSQEQIVVVGSFGDPEYDLNRLAASNCLPCGHGMADSSTDQNVLLRAVRVTDILRRHR
jgi:hypothetical protein